MKEVVTVDKEVLMKLLRACDENCGFVLCELCDGDGVDDIECMDACDCVGNVFKKLTEVE